MTARAYKNPELPPFVLLQDDVAGVRRVFAKPIKIITAYSVDDLELAFQEIEEAKRAGKWLAGYFSYEAGYALEQKLLPLLGPRSAFPLVLIGVFDDADICSFTPANRASPAPAAPLKNAKPRWTREQYKVRFDRLKKHIAYGDCYQANLTFPIESNWQGDPITLFHTLTERQPVRHGAIINLQEPMILSRSPELFFAVNADGWIETRPMKGTAKRGKTPEEDDAIRDGLAHDAKNQAENRMIVDLLRNDISRISEVGTLDVPELFKVETYPTLHQMVSRIHAKLLPNLTVRDIFAALFPCGSITGAPKIRAMEILHDLEEAPRDIYCGSMGWIAPDGQMSFNVSIRTVTLHADGRAVFNVGGGIIFDSEANSEYDECLLKARFAAGQIDPSD
jgi:para-aminobenzoate synthetase component I